jgi:hypothetical protein
MAHSRAGFARDLWVFLLVLIGVELLETLKACVKKDVIHVRVVLEVALIAMARKVIIEEPNAVPSLTLFEIAALTCFGYCVFLRAPSGTRNRTWDFVTRRQAIRDVVASKDRARVKEVAQVELVFRYCFDLYLMDCRVCVLGSAASEDHRSGSQS